MKQLYEVTTKEWKKYYAMAHGYDDAKNKVEQRIFEEDDSEPLSGDGSLNISYYLPEIEGIKCLSNNLIE